MAVPTGWSTEKLAEFLAAVLSFATEGSASHQAMARIAEALDAKVAAIVSGGKLVAVTGYPEGEAPVAELDAVARGARRELTVPGAGLCPAIVVPLGDALNARLVVARSGPGTPLTADEIVLVEGMARMTLMLGTLADRHALLERLADEQAALRRVATLVARGAPPDGLFAVVAAEVARVVRVPMVSIVCYEVDGSATERASFSEQGEVFPVGTRWSLDGTNVVADVRATRRPARIDDYDGLEGAIAQSVRRAGIRSTVASPIVVAGRLWGAMVVSSAEVEPLPEDTEARLASFTDLLATAIANAESRRELAASRTRIVTAADHTRRGIERDLHDGAQQRLVSLTLELRAVQAAVPPELKEVECALSRLADGLADVQDELLEMARGIHPAILARGGLAPALKTLTRRVPIPVELDVRVDGRLPEHVEVPAYYVVSEALTNAVKHARASVVQVDVEQLEGALRVWVNDDGIGGADPTRGSGLVGLKDRVEAFGGMITIQSPFGAGTSIQVELPLDA